MLKKYVFLTLPVIALMQSSCEDDFSLNGDYQITPVVFGLLDDNSDVHIIKITKAYMGDGDNLVYAQIPDSNYFTSVDARVIEYKNNAKTGKEWTLHDSTITNKDTTGIFYGPDQKVYVFYASDLDPQAEYELVADLNEGAHTIKAKTTMISGFKVADNLYLNKQITFAANTVSADQDYKNWTFVVTEGKYGSRYNYKYVFRWTEYYDDNTTASFSAEYNNGDQFQKDPASPLAQTASYRGLDFYKWVADVVPDDPSVIRRKVNGIDLKISVAHKDLNQFMEVAKPVTTIAQSQPEYTNIDGGLGLFSSRIILEIPNFYLSKPSRKELCRGQYTVTKLFCSDNVEDATENYYCP